jgi:[acyl-carrier-protein] S-malonyltransferase
MGQSLYDAYPAARRVFDRAGDEIKRWCFEGTKEELRQTHVTQPTVFTVDVAACAALTEALTRADLVFPGTPLLRADLVPQADFAPQGILAREADPAPQGSAQTDDIAPADPAQQDFAQTAGGGKLIVAGLAGFSLGEYAALTAAGCIADFETALDLVKKRGDYMAEAGRDTDGAQKGAMLAVFGERRAIQDAVDAARAGGILEAVNFNAPAQTVAAGDLAAIDRLRKRVKETSGLKAVPLSVSTAFHSPMMAPAAERLADAVLDADFSAPRVRVYANTTGRDLTEGKPASLSDAAWIRERLALQLKSPVYWQETIENMAADGIELFIELGPGQTLTGLVKKINPSLRALNVEDAESLAAALSSVKEMLA